MLYGMWEKKRIVGACVSEWFEVMDEHSMEMRLHIQECANITQLSWGQVSHTLAIDLGPQPPRKKQKLSVEIIADNNKIFIHGEEYSGGKFIGCVSTCIY